MSVSAVTEGFRAWVAREADVAPLTRFRVAFAAIWLVYDVLDLLTAGTAHCSFWLYAGAPVTLTLLQAALVLCQVVMLLGEPEKLVRVATLAACALRYMEWNTFLRLNDFAYYAVTALILAHAQPVGGYRSVPRGVMAPRWPRDLLIFEAAWIYFATGMMKLNPVWLSGKHLYVRLEYVRYAFEWPFPGFVNRCIDSLPCDSALAIMGVVGELSLATLLVFYPKRRVVTLLAIAIHSFGAIATNVWFFGPSLIAQIAFLTEAS